MANAVKWEAAWVDRSTVLTTELNSLADGSRTAVGSELANQTNLDQVGVLELNVTFGSSPASGGYVTLYMVEALDGTNYEDGSSTVVPASACLVAQIDVRAVTTAQRRRTGLITLHPGKTKFLLENHAGVAFPASGSTVKLYVTNDELQ